MIIFNDWDRKAAHFPICSCSQYRESPIPLFTFYTLYAHVLPLLSVYVMNCLHHRKRHSSVQFVCLLSTNLKSLFSVCICQDLPSAHIYETTFLRQRYVIRFSFLPVLTIYTMSYRQVIIRKVYSKLHTSMAPGYVRVPGGNYHQATLSAAMQINETYLANSTLSHRSEMKQQGRSCQLRNSDTL